MSPQQIEPFARATVTALGVGVLESAALAALVWAMTALRPRPSATTRHVLWWLVLTAAAVLPVVSVIGSLGHIEHRAGSTAPTEQQAVALVEAQAAGTSVDAPNSQPPRTGTRSPNDTRTSRSTRSEPSAAVDAVAALTTKIAVGLETPAARIVALPYLGLALLALWLVVALAGCGRLAAGFLSLARIKRNATPLDDNVVRRLRRWRHSARAGRAVRLAVSNEVDVPVAVGFRTPTILFPIRVVETEEIADIDQIAMHEYAHLDRYDDWTNLFQRALERIFWFNPVVQLVGRRIALEREISCDDWVVAQTGRAHRYATCLWKLVESSRLPAKPILAPGALLSARQITTRIEQLLDGRRNALPRLSPLGALCVAVLCIAAVVVQVQRAPVIALTDVASGAAQADVVAGVTPHAPAASHEPLDVESEVLARVREIDDAALQVAQNATRDALAQTAAKLQAARVPAPAVAPQSAHAKPADVAKWADVAKPADIAKLPALPKTPGVVKATDVRILRIVMSGPHAGAGPLPEPSPLLERVRHTEIAQTPSRLELQSCSGCRLSGAHLRGADLESITLTGADLHGADLRDGQLAGAKLIGVDLQGADLRNADLSGADLTGVDLRDANLSGANLSDAKLHGCNIHGTNFTNADLSGASIDGPNVRGAFDLESVWSHAFSTKRSAPPVPPAVRQEARNAAPSAPESDAQSETSQSSDGYIGPSGG